MAEQVSWGLSVAEQVSVGTTMRPLLWWWWRRMRFGGKSVGDCGGQYS